MSKAEDTQVGGDHYKNLKIQPMRYSMENNLNACQHTVIKYVTRYKSKGGIKDLEKAIHTIQLLIEFELENEAKATVAEGGQLELDLAGPRVERTTIIGMLDRLFALRDFGYDVPDALVRELQLTVGREHAV